MARKILWILLVLIALFWDYFGLSRYLYIALANRVICDVVPRVNKRKPVILSFTTTPRRIEYSRYMLSSILTQSQRVDEIRLYIPNRTSKGEEYIIPDWMVELQKTVSHFHIRRCERDWGPPTKVIPALIEERNHDVYIIYCDDDMIYQRDMVSTLVSYSNMFPRCAIGNSGLGYGKTKNYSFLYHLPYEKNRVKVLEGFAGVIVRPRFFNMEKLLHPEKYPPEMFFQDDVYLSGMLCENGIERYGTCYQRSIPHLKELVSGFILRTNPVSLSSTVNKGDRNLKIALSCFRW